MDKKKIIKEVFEKGIEENESSIKKVVTCEGFYFKEGIEAYSKIKNVDNQTLQKALNYIKNTPGWYATYFPKEGAPKTGEFSDIFNKINAFVAYCDINARGSDINGKSFYGDEGEKKCIAKAYVYQHKWIEGILKYLCRNDIDEIDEKIINAIKYFESPKERFTVLSEKHRELIAKFFFEKDKKILFLRWISRDFHKVNTLSLY